MFKKILEKTSNQYLDYIINHYDKYHKKYHKIDNKHNNFFKTIGFIILSPIAVGFLGTVLRYWDDKWFFFSFGISSLIMFPSILWSHYQDIIKEKMTKEITENIQTKVNTQKQLLILLQELENIQITLQLIDLQEIIYSIKMNLLKNEKISISTVEKLYNCVINNYDNIDSSKIIDNENKSFLNNHILEEMEIGMTSLKRIL